MFQCSKLPCLGRHFTRFFCPECLQQQLKHAVSSTKISMVKKVVWQAVTFGFALTILDLNDVLLVPTLAKTHTLGYFA
jgi:hypothetical protein